MFSPSGFVAREARRIKRNLVVLNLIVLSVVSVAGVALERFLYNIARGPFEVSTEDLTSIDHVKSLREYFVTIAEPRLVATGFCRGSEGCEGRNGRHLPAKATSTFWLLDLGERFLLVEAPGEKPPRPLTGTLDPIPADVKSEVVAELVKTSPTLEQSLVPFHLNAVGIRPYANLGFSEPIPFRIAGLALAITGVTVLLLAIAGLARGLRSESDESGVVWKRLRAFGNPLDVADSIDKDLKQTDVLHFGRYQLGKRWLANCSTFEIRFTRLSDIVWVYRRTEELDYRGTPIGMKRANVRMCTRDGRTIFVQASGPVGHSLLKFLTRRAPHAETQYNDELAQRWREDRESFIADVDQRKRESVTLDP